MTVKSMSNITLAIVIAVSALTVSTFSHDTSCCAALSRALQTEVSYPISSTYDSSLHSYWSAQEEALTPYCIVTPTTSSDVSIAIKILTATFYLTGNSPSNRTSGGQEGCKFAFRSGGHTAHAGSANIANGVTVDLSALNEIRVAQDGSTVTLGPGLRWRDVYKALEPLGLAVAGVRVGGVGVGGSILGGGLSYFSPRAGFTCDSVLSYTLVLANGTLIHANPTTHSALFRALKGGSRNFGIVTAYTLRTFPQGPLWAGTIIYPASTISQHLAAFSAFCSVPNFDVYAALMPSFAFSPSVGEVVFTELVYTRPVVNPPAFRPFTAIEPQLANSMNITTLAPYSVTNDALSPVGSRQLTFATTFANDLPTLQTLYTLWSTSTTPLASIPNITWSLSLQPLNHAITSKGNHTNSLGLPSSPPRGSLILALLSATWTHPAHDARVQLAADTLLAAIVDMTKAKGTWNRFVDLNHAMWGQDPIRGYGSEVVEQMREVARVYDPLGIFQTEAPGGFGLFG